MDARPSIRVLCLPDLDKPIGGVKQLYRHVEHLSHLGWDAAIVTESKGFRPSWFTSTAPTVDFSQCLDNGDFLPQSSILVLPETYVGVNLKSFYGLNLSEFSCVIFNQNPYYSYGDSSLITSEHLYNFYHGNHVLQVLSISEDTHSFLSRNLNIPDSSLSRIVNSIERIFDPHQVKSNRMHWMPRKNPLHVHAVLQGINSSFLSHTAGWEGKALANLSHAQVSESLNTARLFLSFGHPEGFGLPIAEAMAAGCWVVGYSGGGGRELFRFGASQEVEFGDWPGFISAVQDSFTRFSLAPRETELRLKRQSLAIKSLYGIDQERSSIELAWLRILTRFQQWRHASALS